MFFFRFVESQVVLSDVFSSPWCCDSVYEDRFISLMNMMHEVRSEGGREVEDGWKEGGRVEGFVEGGREGGRKDKRELRRVKEKSVEYSIVRSKS